jgi:hypothetical protein
MCMQQMMLMAFGYGVSMETFRITCWHRVEASKEVEAEP